MDRLDRGKCRFWTECSETLNSGDTRHCHVTTLGEVLRGLSGQMHASSFPGRHVAGTMSESAFETKTYKPGQQHDRAKDRKRSSFSKWSPLHYKKAQHQRGWKQVHACKLDPVVCTRTSMFLVNLLASMTCHLQCAWTLRFRLHHQTIDHMANDQIWEPGQAISKYYKA